MGLMDIINNCKTLTYKGFIKELDRQTVWDVSDIAELADLFKKEYTIFRKNENQKLIEVVDYIIIVLDYGNKRKFVKDIKKQETVFACDVDELLDIDDIIKYYEKM